MENRIQAWEELLRTSPLPNWDSLPELELYMDQVVLLLSRYLAVFAQGEEKVITPSIVNNYVRMKIMPPPVKKRYGRIHIAYLIMICTLKQSLSIASIQKMVPLTAEEEEVRTLYTNFVAIYAGAADNFSQHIQTTRQPSDLFPTTMALVACLAKSLTDYLLDN